MSSSSPIEHGSIPVKEAPSPGQAKNFPRRMRLIEIGQLIGDALKLPPLVIISSFAINLLGLALPLVVLQIFDRVLRNQAVNTLFLLIAGLACVVTIEAMLRFARNRLVGDRALHESFKLHMNAVTRYLGAPPAKTAAFTTNQASEAMAAIDDLSRFLSGNARLALLDMPFVAMFLLLIWLIAGPVVILPIILIVAFVFWTIKSSSSFKQLLEQQSIQERERFDFYSECLKGIATVKSLAIEPQMQRRLERIYRRDAQVNHDVVLRANRMTAAGQLFASLTIISLVSVGGLMAIEGHVSLGAVAACLLIGNRITQPVLRIVGVWSQLEAAELAQKRFAPLMSLPIIEERETGATGPARLTLYNIAMGQNENAQDNEGAIGGIDLEIPAGHVAGIVIPDYAERGQFIQLLRGQILPDQGTIAIDGVDLSTDKGMALQHDLFFVGSQPDIFHGTILDNISMFRKISHSTALEAARYLGLDPIVQALPQGYDTRLGDIGASALPLDILQAICVVRATVMRPRLLMIDIRRIPPDDVSTRACSNAIQELQGGSTVLIIGKQMSELRDAGQVYAMKSWRFETVPDVNRTALGNTDKQGRKAELALSGQTNG